MHVFKGELEETKAVIPETTTEYISIPAVSRPGSFFDDSYEFHTMYLSFTLINTRFGELDTRSELSVAKKLLRKGIKDLMQDIKSIHRFTGMGVGTENTKILESLSELRKVAERHSISPHVLVPEMLQELEEKLYGYVEAFVQPVDLTPEQVEWIQDATLVLNWLKTVKEGEIPAGVWDQACALSETVDIWGVKAEPESEE